MIIRTPADIQADIDKLKKERDRLSWLCAVMRPPPAGAWEQFVEIEAQIATLRDHRAIAVEVKASLALTQMIERARRVA